MCSKAKDVAVNKKNTIGYENNFLNLFILNIRELEDTLLKTKGLTIKGAKYFLDNGNSLDLDEISNHSINTSNKEILKKKINKISKLIKNIKIRK